MRSLLSGFRFEVAEHRDRTERMLRLYPGDAVVEFSLSTSD